MSKSREIQNNNSDVPATDEPAVEDQITDGFKNVTGYWARNWLGDAQHSTGHAGDEEFFGRTRSKRVRLGRTGPRP